MTTDAPPDLADVQGNILRGYHKTFVRHLVLTVADAVAARAWLAQATSGDPDLAPQVTNAEPWDEKPPSCVNVGITYQGLVALGVAPASLASFPREFAEGMAARAVKIGDIGDSRPDHWMPSLRDSDAVHLVITIHANDQSTLAETSDRIAAGSGGRAFIVRSTHDGQGFDGGYVHFGYRDNIAQPHFDGIRDPADRPDQQPLAPIGTVLLGYESPLENMRWEVPQPDVLGRNGSFNAFRILEQRVEEFEEFLTDAAETILAHPLADEVLPPGAETRWDPPLTRPAAMRELVAAKILGRWRNGIPLALAPTFPDPSIGEERLNEFNYGDDHGGQSCPMGSHIRRCNPRDARIVQRSTNHTRRIVRRGIPYGPEFDPAKPDGIERGLLGVFICASLIVQFEAIQYDWMNLGLQDPRITGTNDAVVGANDHQHSCFTLPVGATSIELRGFPRFVQTRGGAYCFLPSLSAIRYLATLGERP